MGRKKYSTEEERKEGARKRRNKWNVAHPDYFAEWMEANADKKREMDKKYRESHKEHMSKYLREYYLSETYGMSAQDYQQLLDAQGGKCKVCGKAPGLGKHSGLHVDHDHVTGKVRGLLCYQCNSAIGLTHDDPEILRGLADYLEYEAV